MSTPSHLRPISDEHPDLTEDPHQAALTASGAPLSPVEVALLASGLKAAARGVEAIAREAGATAREAIKAKTERHRLDVESESGGGQQQAPGRKRNAG